MKLYAWIGEDEFGSGEVGIKQGIVPAGCIPLVSIDRSQVDQPYIRGQLQAQATAWGKTIRLAEFTMSDDGLTILSPRPHE